MKRNLKALLDEGFTVFCGSNDIAILEKEERDRRTMVIYNYEYDMEVDRLKNKLAYDKNGK